MSKININYKYKNFYKELEKNQGYKYAIQIK